MIKRFFQFRLSHLLLAMVVVSVVIVWANDRHKMERRIRQLEQRNQTTYRSGYGAQELLGPPDVLSPADNPRAWCPASSDSQKEWIDLRYKNYVRATKLVIHENYYPGAVYRITGFDWRGREITLWKGVDPLRGKQGNVARIPVNPNFKSKRFKVYLDSPAVSGWNEIDAVGVIDRRGKTHWAVDAQVSSAYGGSSQSTYMVLDSF